MSTKQSFIRNEEIKIMSNSADKEASRVSARETLVLPKVQNQSGEPEFTSTTGNTSFVGSDPNSVCKMEGITLFMLCFIPLIYNMETFAFSSALDEVTINLDVDNSPLDLHPAVISYIYFFCAPAFGYLGDRYSRKAILAFGMVLWSIATLAASLLITSFGWFSLFRIISEIGQVAHVVIAPSIIGDMFVGDLRSKVLAIFYVSITISSVLGYLVGALVTQWISPWYWSLRLATVCGVLTARFILCHTSEQARGEREFSQTFHATSWGKDAFYLFTNISFLLTTVGFTGAACVHVALRWWAPKYLFYGLFVTKKGAEDILSTMTFQFGIMTLLSEIIGVPLGALASIIFRRRNQKVDPVICGIGMLVSIPFLVSGFLVESNPVVRYILLFLGQVCMKLNHSIVSDMLLYVVTPTRRCTAHGIQVMLSANLGSSFNPLLIILGGPFFLLASKFIAEDKKKCQEIVSSS